MIQIIHVPTPAFVIKEDGTVRAPFEEEWNPDGEHNVQFVHSHFFNDQYRPETSLLQKFQEFLDEKENAGFTKCYFYNMHTQHEPDGVILFWVRVKFTK